MQNTGSSGAASAMARVVDDDASSDTKPKSARAKKAAKRASAKAKAAAKKAAGRGEGKGHLTQRDLQNKALDTGSCFKWQKGTCKNKERKWAHK